MPFLQGRLNSRNLRQRFLDRYGLYHHSTAIPLTAVDDLFFMPDISLSKPKPFG
ncbi:MAG: hypothetical protein ACYDG8_01955 [Vulcanimicrobiaceae bacterium]